MRAPFMALSLLPAIACGGGGRPPQPPRPPAVVEARPYFTWYGTDPGAERKQYAIDAANQVALCVGVDPRQVFRDHVVYVFDEPFSCGAREEKHCGCSTYLTQIQVVVGEPCDYRVGMATELLHQVLWYARESTDYSSPRWKRVEQGGCRWWTVPGDEARSLEPRHPARATASSGLGAIGPWSEASARGSED